MENLLNLHARVALAIDCKHSSHTFFKTLQAEKNESSKRAAQAPQSLKYISPACYKNLLDQFLLIVCCFCVDFFASKVLRVIN